MSVNNCARTFDILREKARRFWIGNYRRRTQRLHFPSRGPGSGRRTCACAYACSTRTRLSECTRSCRTPPYVRLRVSASARPPYVRLRTPPFPRRGWIACLWVMRPSTKRNGCRDVRGFGPVRLRLCAASAARWRARTTDGPGRASGLRAPAALPPVACCTEGSQRPRAPSRRVWPVCTLAAPGRRREAGRELLPARARRGPLRLRVVGQRGLLLVVSGHPSPSP